jgi:hypothetical protein
VVGVKTAVIGCEPVDNVTAAEDAVALVVPVVTATALPSAVVPSMNCTLPAADGVTVAVNVVAVPAVVGLGGLATTVVVVAVAPPVPAVTWKLSGREVELPNALGVLDVNTAVMECVSTDRFDVVKVALPPSTATALPSASLPSMNCTEPGAVDGVMVAVKITDVPDGAGPPGFAAIAVVVAVAPDAFTA